MKDEQNMDGKWQATPVAPWRRFAARTIDTTIYVFLGFAILMSSIKANPNFFIQFNIPVLILATLLICLVVAGTIIGLFGTSIGKWIFGVRVTNKENKPIGLYKGIGRELNVVIYGLGLGIPIISFITQFIAYRKLKREGTTSWDSEGEHIVSHRPNGLFQYFMNTVGIILLFIQYLVFATIG
jgi:uncharacterized RDD family membrane protein YckC